MLLVWWVGGVIAGKAVCEDLCCSGSSFATALGPVRNPYNEDYAAGGSSSGCAALVRRKAIYTCVYPYHIDVDLIDI
jgi:amidase